MAELACPADAAARIQASKVTVTPIEGGIRVEAQGVSVHGSTPEQGENAIGRLALALTQLPLEGELADCMAFLAGRIGMETHGESLGLAMRDDLSGDLTVNLGVAAFWRRKRCRSRFPCVIRSPKPMTARIPAWSAPSRSAASTRQK